MFGYTLSLSIGSSMRNGAIHTPTAGVVDSDASTFAAALHTATAGTIDADTSTFVSKLNLASPVLSGYTLSLLTETASQTDPGGGSNAVRFNVANDSGVSHSHTCLKAPTGAAAASTTVEVWLKSGTKTWEFIALGGGGNIYLDLGTGNVGAKTAGFAASIIAGTAGAGNWQLWRITGTWAATNLSFDPANGNNSVNYADDGTGTIFMGTGPFGPFFYQ